MKRFLGTGSSPPRRASDTAHRRRGTSTTFGVLPSALASVAALSGVDFSGVTLRFLSSHPTPEGRQRDRVVVLHEAPRGIVELIGATSRQGSSAEEIDHASAMCREEPAGSECPDDLFSNETEPHPVTLRSFSIDRLEVTAGDYDRCADRGVCAPRPTRSGGGSLRDPLLPATLVTWSDAQTYCLDRGGRLPTEAEWEFAARGLSGRRYPWGDVFDRYRLNGGRFAPDPLESADGYAELAPVGSFSSGTTPSGIHDLAGNAEEWVADWYAPDYPDASLDNPRGPEQGEERVVRGGSYVHGGAWTRASARGHDVPSARRAWRGFRCAYELASPR
jgi:sulfatase modifying factor 1